MTLAPKVQIFTVTQARASHMTQGTGQRSYRACLRCRQRKTRCNLYAHIRRNSISPLPQITNFRLSETGSAILRSPHAWLVITPEASVS